MLMESWLDEHGQEVRARIPEWSARWVESALEETTAELSAAVLVLFVLAAGTAALAVLGDMFLPFYLTAAAFIGHALPHVGQALILKRYVPALATSLGLILPYGVILYQHLISTGTVNPAELAVFQLVGLVMIVPLIAGSRALGRLLYRGLEDLTAS